MTFGCVSITLLHCFEAFGDQSAKPFDCLVIEADFSAALFDEMFDVVGREVFLSASVLVVGSFQTEEVVVLR